MKDTTYGLSHLDPTRANTYDRELAVGYQGMLWEHRERPLVLTRLAALRKSGASQALDLACGTGRILELQLEAGLEASGVDISAPMLEVCRARVPRATVVESPLEDFTPSREYDLVTAFRLFTNAEPALRSAAVRAAHRLLKPGGYFLSNVHLQATSPGGAVRQAARVIRRAAYPRPYSWTRHVVLLEANGFSIESTEPYGVLPNLGRRTPTWLVRTDARLEGHRLVRRLPALHDSVLVIARRDD